MSRGRRHARRRQLNPTHALRQRVKALRSATRICAAAAISRPPPMTAPARPRRPAQPHTRFGRKPDAQSARSEGAPRRRTRQRGPDRHRHKNGRPLHARQSLVFLPVVSRRSSPMLDIIAIFRALRLAGFPRQSHKCHRATLTYNGAIRQVARSFIGAVHLIACLVESPHSAWIPHAKGWGQLDRS